MTANWTRGNRQAAAEIAELLLKAAQTRICTGFPSIRASRPGNPRIVFTRTPDAPNHFTLLDLVIQFYAPPYPRTQTSG